MVALALCVVLGQVADAPNKPLQSMTRSELKLEYAKLDQARPSLGLPVGLTTLGAVVTVCGSALVWSRSQRAGGVFRRGDASGWLSSVLLGVGLTLLLPSIWLWWTRGTERAAIGERMEEVDTQLDELDREFFRRRGQTEPDYPP